MVLYGLVGGIIVYGGIESMLSNDIYYVVFIGIGLNFGDLGVLFLDVINLWLKIKVGDVVSDMFIG